MRHKLKGSQEATSARPDNETVAEYKTMRHKLKEAVEKHLGVVGRRELQSIKR